MRHLARTVTVVILLAFAFFYSGTPAKAALTCPFTTTNPSDFGTIDTTSGSNYTASINVGVTCSNGTPGDLQVLCVQVLSTSNGNGGSSGPLYMSNGSNTLSFYAYQNSSRTTAWPLGTWIGYPFTLDPIAGGGSGSETVYLKIPSGQATVPPGGYSTTMTINMKVGDGLNFSDCSGTPQFTQSAAVTIKATDTTACTVSGSALNFGSIALLTSNVDAQTTISLTCANSTAWTLTLDGGQHGGTSATNRKMVNGANSVTYGLFKDAARTQGLYGSTGTVTGTGTGTAQSVSVYGRVAPQTTPPPATYTDTVVISVSY
jgi:spore coat protein U-like protein